MSNVKEAAALVVEQWMKEPEGSILLERAVCELEVALEPEELAQARARRIAAEVKLLTGFFHWLAKGERINPRQTVPERAALEYINTLVEAPLPPTPLPSTDKELGSFADTHEMQKITREQAEKESKKP